MAGIGDSSYNNVATTGGRIDENRPSNDDIVDELLREQLGEIRLASDNEDSPNMAKPESSSHGQQSINVVNEGPLSSRNSADSLAEGRCDSCSDGEEEKREEEKDKVETPTETTKRDEYAVDEVHLREVEAELTEQQLEARYRESCSLKAQGNAEFRACAHVSALDTYTLALNTCPLTHHHHRALLYANRAAARAKLDDVENAISDCSKALELDGEYVKALLRRAKLYEETEKLDEALVDYKRLVELDPGLHEARAACMRLPEQINERNEKLKTEMLGKLKDLGNMILRPFGLSTNNFQVNQDPGSGSYSVNFQQRPPPQNGK